MHFDAHAGNYAGARPPYPPALWQHLREHHLMRPGGHVLDLGAGTGQATGPLLDAGLEVTAVEPGTHLAARLKTSCPAATVIASRAEDIDLPAASFDMVVAATSIHWLDLEVVLPKIHRLLVPNGRFVVWRTVFADPAVSTPFRDRVADIVRVRDVRPRTGLGGANAEAMAVALTERGLFAVDDLATFRWHLELDEVQVRRLFSTFSDWSAQAVDKAGEAVRDLGGYVVEHYTTWSIVLRPRQCPTR